ncbi:DUF4044 domain-containing protein [Lactobacillus selangorensis]|nr:DUF4044 domain-containing protein [Lactobacillus selangorensis]
MKKKPKSTFTKITQVFIWMMIIITVAGVVLGAASAFF